MKRVITQHTSLHQGDKMYWSVQIEGVFYWTYPLPIEEKFPQIVVERDVNGGHFLFQVDNEHDIDNDNQLPIFAQSQNFIEGVPVINIDDFINELAETEYEAQTKEFEDSKDMWPVNNSSLLQAGFIDGYKTCLQSSFTKLDIERALSLAFLAVEEGGVITTEEILNELTNNNTIYHIEVDKNFKIISF